MISSAGNAQMKYLLRLQEKRKLRETEGVYVCEGRRLFDEVRALRGGDLLKSYIAESYYRRLLETEPDYLSDISAELVEDSVFAAVSQTVTPQGILAIVRQPQYTLAELLGGEDTAPLRLLVLENLRDPGNLGTIVRTAEGAGMNGLILSKGCAEMFNPKVIRATMGSIYRVPFVYVASLEETLRMLRQRNIAIYAAHLAGSVSYDRQCYGSRSAILIGNEANGLTAESAALADVCVRIPMAGQLESLNAAVAAAILMYEGRRQAETHV